jgi:hypothetical protein
VLESLLTARFALVGWAFLVAALGQEQALVCLLYATLRQIQENQSQPRPVVVVVVVVQTLVGLIHAWAETGFQLLLTVVCSLEACEHRPLALADHPVVWPLPNPVIQAAESKIVCGRRWVAPVRVSWVAAFQLIGTLLGCPWYDVAEQALPQGH